MATVKIGWSGGKDSTRAVMAHIQRGDKVKAVCYVPMFTKEIPLISKKHYDFILKTAEYFRLYSPQYACNGKKKMRDGCSLCCNASEKEREEWFEDYPEAIPLVIELQNIVKKQRPDRPPLRDYKYFIE